MPSWLPGLRKSENISADETLIRVCVVSRDPVFVEEVHQDLMVGFSTRGRYDFEGAHPDFQQFCDVLFVDLRAAGAESGSDSQGAGMAAGEYGEGLAFVDAIRASVSHPPIVALCNANADDFKREVMRRGAYDTLSAPLNTPQLRLTLQRAYEFRLAETRLESFLTQQAIAKERLGMVRSRNMRTAASPARHIASQIAAPRASRPVRAHFAPSRLAIGFVLGCVIFFAGLVAVRTILTGMGDALASAGFAADSGGGSPETNTVAPGGFATRDNWPLTASADFSQGALDPNSPRRFGAAGELGGRPHSSLEGYEPAALIERVTPRYSVEARSRHLQGKVQIRALIGPDGVPRGIARVSGDPTLAQIAMDAIALWRYAPATLDGQPVKSEVIIPVDFQLPD